MTDENPSPFRFSQRSLDNLVGVKPELVDVCHAAIAITKVDFGIIDGLRTAEEQRELYDRGASKLLNSKHLFGAAVDVMAYVGARGSWELPLYNQIADAFAKAARGRGVAMRWGGAWHIPDIREWDASMADAMKDYIETRISEGRDPFVDAGHFELN